MKRSLHLWLTVSVASFFSLQLLMLITGITLYHLTKVLPVKDSVPPKWFGTLTLFYLVMLISLFMTLAIIHLFLKPLNKLIKAQQEVAAGNLEIQLDLPAGKNKFHYSVFDNFNKMVRELGSIETLRSDFVSNVSHEFKTPIAAIEGYASLLVNPYLSKEEQVEYARRILDSSKKLSSLTSNVLMLSRLENQEIYEESREYSLDEQLREAILMLEKNWSEKSLQIDIDISPVLYTGNENLLLQVWTNLYSNAIKFTPPGGIISTKLFKDSKHITVTITDTGCGMSEQVQKHIFDRFYQGDSDHHTEGNGLGLSLVKRIVELSGGKILVKSQPGFGSTFTVQLPG